jgi:hypothetical protein
MAHTRGMLDKQGYMHTRACTRPLARVNALTRALTHTQIRDIYYFSTTATNSEVASVLRYTYNVCSNAYLRMAPLQNI